MLSIGHYAEIIGTLLGEAGKYLIVLALLVVAIRLWRAVLKGSATKSWASLGLALAFSVACAGSAWVSMQHSLARMYYYYGVHAFREGHTPSAEILFRVSAEHWKSADALGHRGVCLLLTDHQAEGKRLVKEAESLRHGDVSTFEAFYSGLFYFFHNQPDLAVPYLSGATIDSNYRWAATRLLAAIKIDDGKTQDARELLQPYAKMEVTDCDHAYVLASLELMDGKQVEARSLLEHFPTKDLSDFWKPKFEKLRLKAQPKTT